MPLLRRRATQREEEVKFAELQVRMAARLGRLSAPKRKVAPTAKSLDEFDTRARKRVVVDHPALVICEKNEDTSATIIDMSEDGLRMRFSHPHYLEPTVLIDSPAFTGFVVANVKWQSGREAGVAFDHDWTRKLSAPLAEKIKDRERDDDASPVGKREIAPETGEGDREE